MSVTPDVFARLVGRDKSRHCLLFEVAPEFIGPAKNSVFPTEWSEPVQYRFTMREGSFVELEFHRIDPQGGPL